MSELVPEFKDMANKLVDDLQFTLIIPKYLNTDGRRVAVNYLSGWLKHNFHQYLDVCYDECECNEDTDDDHERPSWMEDRDSR